jgi:hypothetical protein
VFRGKFRDYIDNPSPPFFFEKEGALWGGVLIGWRDVVLDCGENVVFLSL